MQIQLQNTKVYYYVLKKNISDFKQVPRQSAKVDFFVNSNIN